MSCHENGELPAKIKRIDEHRPVTVVLGTQWGDEGKGKVVDMLAANADLCCRCQGGNNAGHSVHVQDKHYAFHLLPSGVIYPSCKGVIGNGVVINLPDLFIEMESNAIDNLVERLVISDRAHLVFDMHQQVDGMLESGEDTSRKIGTTKKGIGPTYSSKATRNGLRISDLVGDFSKFSEKFKHLVDHFKQMFPELLVDIDEELLLYKDLSERVRPMVKETVSYLHSAIVDNKRILVECAQSTILDIDFAQRELLQNRGAEFGVTTGRPRRCGWLDLAMLKYSHMINGFTALAVTKLDILDVFEEIKVGVAYTLNGERLNTFPASDDDLQKLEVEYKTLPGWKEPTENIREFSHLPVNAQSYIHTIETEIGVKVRWVGVGKDRNSIITIS